MKTLIFATSMLSAMMAGTLHAQIYADITVSHGGSSLGTFRVDLDYINAPRTCANFIGLATGQRAWLDSATGKVTRGKKYYDGLICHRLIHNFMIQGGDPQGNGQGGPGYVFQDEFHPSLRHSARYKISMANSGPHSNGSQFFILLESASQLDDKHSVFGEVINDTDFPNGRAIIDGFTNNTVFEVQPVDTSLPENLITNPKTSPVSPIVIESVIISGPSLASFDVNASSHKLPTVNGVPVDISYNPDTDLYTQTFDRKGLVEYHVALTTDLVNWNFPVSGIISYPYFLGVFDEVDWGFTLGGVSGPRFFSRLTEIDYRRMPLAPAGLIGNGQKIQFDMGGGESVTLTFNGSNGGSWLHSGGTSGTISNVTWFPDLSSVAGPFFHSSSPGRKMPLGRLKMDFDTFVGTRKWKSLDFSTQSGSINRYINFHSESEGWCEGVVEVEGLGGIGTAFDLARIPFAYILPST